MRVVSASTGLLAPPADGSGGDGASTVRLQVDAGVDLVAAGPAGRDGLLAALLTDHAAIRAGDPEPYPYGDCFYRPPVVVDALGAGGGTPAVDAARTPPAIDAAVRSLRSLDADPGDCLQPVLPGPYTLAALARDEHYGDPADFLDAVAGFLAAEARALPAVAAVALLEPALVADPPGDGLDARASDAVDAVAAAVDAPVVVHCPGGALTPKVHAHLLDADVAAVGYDFTANHDASLSLVAEYGTADGVGLGVLDARDPEVESADTVRERIEWVLDSLPPVMEFDAVYAAPGDALHRLARAVGVEKLRALADGVAAWRGQV